jgi:hypothetical protein
VLAALPAAPLPPAVGVVLDAPAAPFVPLVPFVLVAVIDSFVSTTF